MYPPLQYHTEQFHCSKNYPCSADLSLSLAIINLFTVSSFTFSKMSCSWNHTLCSIFSLAYFTQCYDLKVLPCRLRSFLLLPNNTYCMNISQFICPFTYWGISWLLPAFSIYEQSFSKYFHADFYVDISSQLICNCRIIYVDKEWYLP